MAPGVGTRCFKTFSLPEEGDENKTECLLPISKALVLLGLEHRGHFLHLRRSMVGLGRGKMVGGRQLETGNVGFARSGEGKGEICKITKSAGKGDVGLSFTSPCVC